MNKKDIAKTAKMLPIKKIAVSLGLCSNDIVFYGEKIAKIKTNSKKN